MIRIFVAKILMIQTDRHCLDLHCVAVAIRKTATLHRIVMALNNAGKADLVVSKANGSLKTFCTLVISSRTKNLLDCLASGTGKPTSTHPH